VEAGETATGVDRAGKAVAGADKDMALVAAEAADNNTASGMRTGINRLIKRLINHYRPRMKNSNFVIWQATTRTL